MASDFDEYARRAARREQAAAGGKRGLTRRHVVKGAAWSAPVIMTAMAAPAFAQSQGTIGGPCGNQGTGVCGDGSKCNGNGNHCNNCQEQPVCGGEGARCCQTGSFTQCDPDPALGLVCVADATFHSGGLTYCRRPCSTGCAAGQICYQGYCARPCGSPGASCSINACTPAPGVEAPYTGICNYTIQNDIVCPAP